MTKWPVQKKETQNNTKQAEQQDIQIKLFFDILDYSIFNFIWVFWKWFPQETSLDAFCLAPLYANPLPTNIQNNLQVFNISYLI